MKPGWIKRTLPRSLYGRAALILLLPVLTLQLVVSVVFIQRHFEGVTRQMTRNVAGELTYLVQEVEAAPDAAAARGRIAGLARALDMEVTLPSDGPLSDDRPFYDLSGRTVTAVLHQALPGMRGVDLAADSRELRLLIDTSRGPMRVVLNRRTVSASNPHQLLVLMIVTGLFMTLIAFLFLRNQLRPITRLARAAEAFGKGRVVRYRPSGATEVRSAGNAFLDMRNRIERQIEQRTLMLSGVSHDLRTPLTRLKLSLSMAEESDETRAMQRDVEDMERMLGAFLDFARADALDDPQPCDPAALLQHAVDKARAGGGEVELGALPEGVEATLRPLAVERALQNLLDNALRYGNRARAELDITDKVVRFTVEDDGPGIPRERREEAMKPFHRLDAARNQNLGTGVGLGLAIASDIARSHGGILRLGRSAAMGGLRAELVLAR
jgi:two-component system osmolarity sensor histidine kinase EnvZ